MEQSRLRLLPYTEPLLHVSADDVGHCHTADRSWPFADNYHQKIVEQPIPEKAVAISLHIFDLQTNILVILRQTNEQADQHLELPLKGDVVRVGLVQVVASVV